MTNTLLAELRVGDHNDYRRYLRIDSATFDYLLDCIRPKIERKDTNWRCSVSAEDRLAVTLRYLATGKT